MRKNSIVPILVAVFAAPAGLPYMVVPQLYPDLPRWALWVLFGIGVTAQIAIVGCAVYLATDRDPAAIWRRRQRGARTKFIRRALYGGIFLICGGAWYFLPLDPLRNELPGFSTYVLLTIFDRPDFHRRYLYKFGSDSGPQISMFMTASNAYTYSVTDTHGEKYPLEMKVGEAGILLNRTIGLFSEVAITEKTTILRVSMNGQEIIRRTIPFPISISGPLMPATLGSDENGGEHGNFLLKRLAIWQLALSNDEIANIDAQAKKP